MSRLRKGLATIEGINVTPLTDLTFLLLITFIITAPILEFTVQVNPPELNSQEELKDAPHRIVTLDAGGILYLGQDTTTPDALVQALAAALVESPDLQVFIRADENRPYGEVMGVLKNVKAAGVTNFSLVTRGEDE
jgi:biopolymer transport protein ExbD